MGRNYNAFSLKGHAFFRKGTCDFQQSGKRPQPQGRRTRKICGDFVFYSHKIKLLASHRSHETCSPPEGAKGNLTKHTC